MNEFTCKIYIQHDGSFYLFEGDFDTVREALTRGILAFPADQETEQRDFPVGSKVYFEEIDWTGDNIGWTEVALKSSCSEYMLNRIFTSGDREDEAVVYFKKIEFPLVPTPSFNEKVFAKELSVLLNKHGLTECVFAGTHPNESRMFGLFGAETKDGNVTEKQMIAAGFNAARIYQSAREKIMGTLNKIGEKR